MSLAARPVNVGLSVMQVSSTAQNVTGLEGNEGAA